MTPPTHPSIPVLSAEREILLAGLLGSGANRDELARLVEVEAELAEAQPAPRRRPRLDLEQLRAEVLRPFNPAAALVGGAV